MNITDSYVSSDGTLWNVAYQDIDSMEAVKTIPIKSVGAICFCGYNLVLVYNAGSQKWEIPGGMIEVGEIPESAIAREIKEESNMRVLTLVPLGYEVLTNTIDSSVRYQMRFGATVGPFSDFMADPDGDISEIKLIDPERYGEYMLRSVRMDHLIQKVKNTLAV